MNGSEFERVEVPDHITGLLCALVYGWKPTPMALGRVEQLWYDELDVTELARDVHLEGATLITTLVESGPGRNFDALMSFNMDAKLRGDLIGGATFQMEMICSVSMAGAIHAPMKIEAARWVVLNGDAPSIWVGRVEGLGDIDINGNLVVERLRPDGLYLGRRCHFCLSGVYVYYFVYCRKDRIWHLVIDTRGAGMPDSELLGRDFLILQFVLGHQLRMPVLNGVDAERLTVACAVGCATRKILEDGSFPPVPIGRNNHDFIRDSWASLFFERISATWRGGPCMTMSHWTMLDMYLDAMRHHLDGDYMRLQIALEAFAYGLPKDERTDVKDKKVWKEWVKQNQGSIHAHAVPGREDALYQKVMVAYRLSSGKVVPSAFAQYDMTLTDRTFG